MIERSPTKVSTRVESAFPQNLDWWWMEFANELTYPDYSSNYEDQTAAPGELINSYCYHIDEARSFFPDFLIYLMKWLPNVHLWGMTSEM